MVFIKLISVGVLRVNQFIVRRGKLYYKGKFVDVVEMKDVLQKFVNWFKVKNKKVVFFVYNVNVFDLK